MFLFDEHGFGVTFNDDNPAGGVQSRITGALVPGPGIYHLAVGRYNRDATAFGLLLWQNAPFDTERAPDGPGAAFRVDGWTGPTTASASPCTVFLTGASFAAGATSVNYGVGAGSDYGVPSLTATGLPQVGGDITLHVMNPDPTNFGGALAIAAQRGSIPFLHGTVLLDVSLLLLSRTLPGLPMGTTNLPLALPNDATLCGLRLAVQAVLAVATTPTAPAGATMTQGLELVLGL
jgi:hypothetical protein